MRQSRPAVLGAAALAATLVAGLTTTAGWCRRGTPMRCRGPAARRTPTSPGRCPPATARRPRCRIPGAGRRHGAVRHPGTFAAWSTKPLSAPVVSVGVPTLTLRLSSPLVEQTQAAGPAGQLLLFAKIYDIAPDGTKTLVHRLISPMRVADVTKPVTVELPGVVHRYATGHRLSVVRGGHRRGVPQQQHGAAGHGGHQPRRPRRPAPPRPRLGCQLGPRLHDHRDEGPR